jgi:hypothetical protein
MPDMDVSGAASGESAGEAASGDNVVDADFQE